MDISLSKACYLLSLTLFLNSCFGTSLSSSLNISSNHNNLIYRHCANHSPFTDHPAGSLQQILSSLFQELVEQSWQSKFFETSIGDEEIAISGLFQCRNDLSNGDCHDCVSRLPDLSKSACGEAIPARIHLSGCYLHYKADESQTSRVALQHKTCSESKAESSEFQELRDAAFAELESSVVKSGNGFSDMSYESMHLMAQCGGNLGGGCDCGGCVNNAVQIAQDECGYSVSGEVYLDSCFINYSYNEKEIPTNTNQGSGTGNGKNSGKLVAIVVGGAAALLFGFMFLYCCRSLTKKNDDDW